MTRLFELVGSVSSETRCSLVRSDAALRICAELAVELVQWNRIKCELVWGRGACRSTRQRGEVQCRAVLRAALLCDAPLVELSHSCRSTGRQAMRVALLVMKAEPEVWQPAARVRRTRGTLLSEWAQVRRVAAGHLGTSASRAGARHDERCVRVGCWYDGRSIRVQPERRTLRKVNVFECRFIHCSITVSQINYWKISKTEFKSNNSSNGRCSIVQYLTYSIWHFYRWKSGTVYSKHRPCLELEWTTRIRFVFRFETESLRSYLVNLFVCLFMCKKQCCKQLGTNLLP